MTKQDEQTKHLEDDLHMFLPYEIVPDVLSCAFTNNLKWIIWRDFRGKALLYERNLELSSYLSFFAPFFFCEFSSCVLKALTKGDVNTILAKEFSLLKRVMKVIFALVATGPGCV